MMQELEEFINILKEFSLLELLFQMVNDDDDIGTPSKNTLHLSIGYLEESFRHVQTNPLEHGSLEGTKVVSLEKKTLQPFGSGHIDPLPTP